MPNGGKYYKSPNGKYVSESELKSKYREKFNSVISNFQPVNETLYKAPNGNFAVESELKSKYGDKYGSVISQFEQVYSPVKKKEPTSIQQGGGSQPSTPGLAQGQGIGTTSSVAFNQGGVQPSTGAANDLAMALKQMGRNVGDVPATAQQSISGVAASGQLSSDISAIKAPKEIPYGVQTFGQPSGRQPVSAAGIASAENAVSFAQEKISELENARQQELSYIPETATQEINSINQRYNNLIDTEKKRISTMSTFAQGAKTDLLTNIPQKPKPEMTPIDWEKEGANIADVISKTAEEKTQAKTFFEKSQERDKKAIDEYQNVILKDVDTWAQSMGDKLTEENVSDIKSFQDYAKEILGNESYSDVYKRYLLDSKYDELQAGIKASDFDKRLNYQADVRGESVNDVIFEKQSEVASYAIDNLPEDMRDFTKSLWDQSTKMKSFMDYFYDPTGESGFNIIDGKIIYSKNLNEKQIELLEKKSKELMNEYNSIMDSQFEWYNEEIFRKRKLARDLDSKIDAAERRLNEIDKNVDPQEWNRIKSIIDSAKKDSDKMWSDVESYDGLVSTVFMNDPKKTLNMISGEIQNSDSAKAAFSSGIKGTSLDRFKKGYMMLLEETERLQEELGFDDNRINQINQQLGMNVRSWLDIESLGLDLSSKEKEWLANRRILNSLAPIFLNNNTGITEQSSSFMDGLVSGFQSFITPDNKSKQTQTGVIRDQLSYISENGFQKDDFIDKDVVKNLEKRVEEVPWYSAEGTGEMIGVVAAVMTDLAVSNALLANPASTLIKGSKHLTSMAKAYDKSMDASKVGRFLKSPIEQGLRFEAAGNLIGSGEDELNFTSGFLGSVAGDATKKIFKAMPSEKIGGYVNAIFGGRTPQAVDVFRKIGSSNARGVGEVAEEFTQELVQIYNSELGDRGFWEEVGNRFGEVDDVMQFVVSSYLMGAAFSFSDSSEAKKKYNELPTEKKQVVDQILSEAKEDIAMATSEVVNVAEKIAKQESQPEESNIDAQPDIIEETTEGQTMEGETAIEEISPTEDNAIIDSEPTIVSEKINVENVEGGDTEYKINDGFYNETEFIAEIDKPDFVEKVESGEIKVDIQNPSNAVQEKLMPTPTVYTPETVVPPVAKVETNKGDSIDIKVPSSPVNSYQKKLIVEAEPENVSQAIMQYFVRGGKITESDLIRETGFGTTNKMTGNINGQTEYEAKKSLFKTKEGDTALPIDKIQETLGGEYEWIANMDSQEFRNAVVDIITNNDTPSQMLSTLRDEFSVNNRLYRNQGQRFEASYMQSQMDKYAELETFEREKRMKEEEELIDAEIAQMTPEKFEQEGADFDKYLETLTDEQIEELYGKFEPKQEPKRKATKPKQRGEGKVDGKKKTSGKESKPKIEIESFESVVTKGTKSAVDWLSDLEAKLDQFGKETLGMNLPVAVAKMAIKAAKVAAQGTNVLSEIVDAGIQAVKESDWYKSLSDKDKADAEQSVRDVFERPSEVKIEPEKEVVSEQKKPEPKKKEGSKQKEQALFGRIRKNLDDPRLKELAETIHSEYTEQNQEEYFNFISDIIDELGIEGAINLGLGMEIRSEYDIQKKKALLEVAGSLKMQQARVNLEKARSTGDLSAIAASESEVQIAMMVLAESGAIGTVVGQISSFQKKLHEKFPTLFMIQKLEELERSSELDQKDMVDSTGKKISREEAIRNMRSELEEQIRSEIEAELGEKIKSIEEKIKALNAQKSKPVSDAQKKREIKSRLNSNIAKLKATKNKPSDRLQASILPFKMLSDEQISLIGEIIADFARLGGLSAKQIVSRVTAIAKELSSDVNKDHISEIARTVSEYNELLAEENKAKAERISKEGLTDKEASDLLSKTEELTGKKILDVVKGHYGGRVDVSKSLAQSLIEELDLDADTARTLAGEIEQMISKRIEDRVKVELAKMLSQTVEQTESQKQNRKLITRITRAINMGALNNGADFQKAFEDKFGFRQLDSRSKSRMMDIIDQINTLMANNIKEVEVDGETRQIDTTPREEILKLQREFNTLLEANKKVNTAIFLNELNGAVYISILSNVTSTSLKAVIGSAGGTLAGVFTKTITNPYASFLGMVKATSSIKTSLLRAQTAFRQGVVEVGRTKTMGEFSSDRQSRLERVIFANYKEALKSKQYGKAVAALFGQTLKNVRILAAMDAFLVSQAGIYYETVSNNTLKARKGGLASKMNSKNMDIVYDSIAESEFNDMKSDIESEVDLDIKRGNINQSQRNKEIQRRLNSKIGIPQYMNPMTSYKKKRSQELRENQNYKTFQEAWNLGQYFSLVGTPDGLVGKGTQALQKWMQIRETDSSGVAIGKFTMNIILKFVNLMGNFFNATKSAIPVLGTIDAFMGVGYDPKTGEYVGGLFSTGKYKANKSLVYLRVATNLLTTTAVVAALMDQLEYDDEEEEWVLNPDRMFDFRGPGFEGLGGYSKNKRLQENYEQFSFAMRDENGEFTRYSTFNQYIPWLNSIVATVSAITDDLKGMKSDGDIDKRKYSGSLFAYTGQAFENNLKGFLEGSFNSIGRVTKPFYTQETFADGLTEALNTTFVDGLVSPLIKPAMYQSAGRYIKTAIDAPKKQAKTTPERLVQNLYGIDALLLDDKTDVFGNPYPEANDVQRFITDVPKMSEEYPETVGLLFKFDRGADVSKWDGSEMKPFSTGFSFEGDTYQVRDESIKDEAVKIQQEQFRLLVLEDNDYLNSLETVEELEEELKSLQKQSKDYAKEYIKNKYLDVNDKKAKVVLKSE